MWRVAHFLKKTKEPREAAEGRETLLSQAQITIATPSSVGRKLSYKPLDISKHQIRLLSFLPQANHDGPICLDLSHYPLEQLGTSVALRTKLISVGGEYFWGATGTSRRRNFQIKSHTTGSGARKVVPGRFAWGDYIALSYAWGDPNDTRQIIVNQIPVDVTKNLEAALRILSKTVPARAGMKIWADAVCLNQEDNEEKSKQVPRMREIYRKAFDVVIWLGNDDHNGRPDNESWKAMQLIRILAASWRFDEGRHLKQLMEQDDFSLDALLPQRWPSMDGCWHALRTLLRRPYWNRAWVLQEIFMGGRESPVLCGDEMVQFGELSDATTEWLGYSVSHIVRREMIKERLDQGAVQFESRDPMEPLRNQTFSERAAELGGLPFDPSMRDAGGSFFDTISISSWALDFDCIHLVKRLRYTLGNGNEPKIHPVNMVALGRFLDATKPHDKIYSFMGLMDPRVASIMPPDYEMSFGEVYRDFSIMWLLEEQDHNILTHCVYNENQNFPSWVPDWSQKLFRPLLPIGDMGNRYAAGGGSIVETNISPDRTIMDTFGIIVDNIDGISLSIEDEHTVRLTQPSEKRQAYVDYKDALWRTFLGNREFKSLRVPEPLEFLEFRALLDIPIPKLAGHLPQPYDAAFYEFVERNDSFMIGGKRLDHYFANDGRREPVCTDELSKTMFMKALGDSVAKASMMIDNRRLFCTRKGLIGFAPKAARNGDAICVLIGCSEPLVIRWHQQTDAFKVVGPCYMHGVMEGELVPDIMAGRTAISRIRLS